MDPFFDALAQAMAFFYDLVPSYAFTIVMLTLAVMVVVTPLTLKGTRSMMVMQQVQPEIKKIQQKYKDDRQTLNEEMLKFYKENNISPMGSCLPLLVQMPVFFVLYHVLRGLTRRVSTMGFDVGWVQGALGQGATPTDVPSIEPVFDPAYLKHDSSLYQSLSNTNTMAAGIFGMDLSQSCAQALSRGIVHALPYIVLIAIVGATGFYQQRQIQGRNTNTTVNPQQQMIMKIMPIFLPVISFTLPSGLVLYFAVSNLYRIGQQAFISHSIYGISRHEQRANREKNRQAAVEAKNQPLKAGGKAGAVAADEPKKSFAERMRDMAGIPETSTQPGKTDAGKGQTGRQGRSSASGKGKDDGKTPIKSTTSTTRTTPKSTGGGSKSTASKGAGKSTTSNKSNSSGSDPSSGEAAASSSKPTLQPRARKNKKR